MSAAENKASAQQAYEAFGRGDLDGAMKNMADDIEWIVPGASKISGTYRGKAAVHDFFIEVGSRGFQTTPQHFIAEGDHVVVLTRTSVEGQSSDQADVLTFRDGKVVKFQSAGDTLLQQQVWGSK